MNIKNCFKGLTIGLVALFAYSADLTAKSTTTQQATSVNSIKVVAASSGLKKQQTVKKPVTSWTKIKDLFM